MWIEVSQDFQENRDKYKDFRDALSDSHLDEEEQEELTIKYYTECSEIQEDTQEQCEELRREIDSYKEMTEMSRSDIKVLQTIIGFSWNQRDSLRWPSTFAGYMEIWAKYEIFSWMWPKQMTEIFIPYIEEMFMSLWENEKKDIQATVGTSNDGVFWPKTLSKILENFDRVRDDFLNTSIQQDIEPEIEEIEETQATEEVILASNIPWDHHPKIILPEEELSQYPQEEIEEATTWIEEKVSNYNMKRLHLYFEIEEGNIEWLAVAVMDFQSKYSLDNSDELDVDWKPWSGTLWKIDFTEIDRELLPETNREFIDSFVPDHWKEAVTKFVVSLEPNEILSPSDPITVCDSSNNSAIYLIDGEYKTFPVIYGSWGFSNGYVASGDQKTPRWVPMRFGSVRIPSSPYWDASNGQESSTVMWASLQSTETQTTQDWIQTWKWFHWVADHRMEKMEDTTIWCVGMWVWIVREIARDIQSNWNKWYWFIA